MVQSVVEVLVYCSVVNRSEFAWIAENTIKYRPDPEWSGWCLYFPLDFIAPPPMRGISILRRRKIQVNNMPDPEWSRFCDSRLVFNAPPPMRGISPLQRRRAPGKHSELVLAAWNRWPRRSSMTPLPSLAGKFWQTESRILADRRRFQLTFRVSSAISAAHQPRGATGV